MLSYMRKLIGKVNWSRILDHWSDLDHNYYLEWTDRDLDHFPPKMNWTDLDPFKSDRTILCQISL